MTAEAGTKIDTSTHSYGLARIWSEKDKLAHVSRKDVFLHLIQQSWNGIRTSPVTSVLTAFTIGIALFVLSLFLLFVENTGTFVGGSQSQLAVRLFLKDGTSESDIQRLRVELSGIDTVEAVDLVTAEAALAEFRASLDGGANLLDGLEGDNPLPASLLVRLKNDQRSAQTYQQFEERFGGDASVDLVYYSKGLVQKLNDFLAALKVGGFLGVALVLIVTGFIIANTIRLALYTHRHEIMIMRLVGATDAYVRTPYLIEGFFHGLTGAVISLCFLFLVHTLLLNLLGDVEVFQRFVPQFEFLSVWSILLVLIVGILVGLAGSYSALRKMMYE
jgi:cell division transport system permease protein